MPYYPIIPQAGDIPSQSQAQILSNFTEIDTDFAKDHVALTDGTVANRGFHKYSRYQLQAAGPITTATQVALYCKNDGVAPNLYFRRAAAGAEIVMTANITPVNAIEGQSFLPGGLIIKWGQYAMAGNPDTHFYPIPFPAGTQNVTLCRYGGPAANHISVSGWNAAAFTVWATAGATSVSYIAIGY